MPQLKTYDLFLSHVWRSADNSEYYRLKDFLCKAQYFSWRNYSVPEHDPLGTKTNEGLRLALNLQIAPINCFLVVSGMYVKHRRWIQEEIDIARHYDKPIVGVVPWGQERIPAEVQDVAVEMVNWQTSSIIDAIRRRSL